MIKAKLSKLQPIICLTYNNRIYNKRDDSSKLRKLIYYIKEIYPIQNLNIFIQALIVTKLAKYINLLFLAVKV